VTRRSAGAVARALVLSGQTVGGGARVALVAQGAAYVLGLVTSVLIARALGPAGRGSYFLPVTAAATVVVLVQLGVEVANTYVHAQRGHSLSALATNATALALAIGPLASVGLVGVYLLTRDSLFSGVQLVPMAVVAVSVPFHLHLLWLSNLCLLAKRLTQTQLATLVGAVIQLGGTAVLATLGALTVSSVLAVYLASVVAPWAVHVQVTRGFATVRPRIDRQVLRDVLGIGGRLHAGVVFWYLLLRVDVFIVAAMLGAADVGLYSLAVLFAELVWLLANPLVVAITPFQAAEDLDDAGRLSFKAARFNVALAFALSAVFAATLWWLLPLAYGQRFAPSYGALVALLPGIIAVAASRPLALWLIRHGRPWVYSATMVGAFGVNVALNVVLIPGLGIAGASLASTIAYTSLAVVHITWALRLGRLRLREALAPQPGDLRTLWRALTPWRT